MNGTEARVPSVTNPGFTRTDNVQPMDEILRLNVQPMDEILRLSAEARFENSQGF
ncbi:MAG: hypothetical protein ACYSR5_05415 [Planctomycetota bacterium]|jgi:hypothetical protein